MWNEKLMAEHQSAQMSKINDSFTYTLILQYDTIRQKSLTLIIPNIFLVHLFVL